MSDYVTETQRQRQLDDIRIREQNDNQRIGTLRQTNSSALVTGTSYDPIAPVAAITPYTKEYEDDERQWEERLHEADLDRLQDEQRRADEYVQQQQRESEQHEALLRERLDDEKRQADAAYEQARQEQYREEQEDDERRDEEQAKERRISEGRAADRRLNIEVQERLLDQLRQERERVAAILDQAHADDQRQEVAQQAQLLDAARETTSRDDAAGTAGVADQYRQAEADAWATDDRRRSEAVAAAQGLEMLRQYATSYQLPLAETPQLHQLWEQAAAGDRSYDAARERFWEQVNHSNDANAQYARAMLEAANFQIRQGSQPPLLNLPTGSLNPNLDYQDRVLTLDHAAAQRDASQRATDAANLRFMTGRDNSFRGSRYTADDQPKSPWPWRR